MEFPGVSKKLHVDFPEVLVFGISMGYMTVLSWISRARHKVNKTKNSRFFLKKVFGISHSHLEPRDYVNHLKV